MQDASGTIIVDRRARDAYAELLRHFAAGRITNDDYEDRYYEIETHDHAVHAIHGEVWHFYDDTRRHRLTGRDRLPPFWRQTVAMWIVFLHSDLSYERHLGEGLRGLGTGLLSSVEFVALAIPGPLGWLVTIGLTVLRRRVRARRLATRRPIEDHAERVAFWPFADAARFTAAIRRPRLLA